jgi:hypothetical protein
MGLIFVCGGLVLLSIVFTAANQHALQQFFGESTLAAILGTIFFKAAAIPVTILMLFLIYWLLPNRRLPWRDVVPVSVTIGLALEGLKYINLLTWPFLRQKLEQEYGPFINSVTSHSLELCGLDDHSGRSGMVGAGTLGTPVCRAHLIYSNTCFKLAFGCQGTRLLTRQHAQGC